MLLFGIIFITETIEEGKPSIITSVQVETAVFADCHFLQEAVEASADCA